MFGAAAYDVLLGVVAIAHPAIGRLVVAVVVENVMLIESPLGRLLTEDDVAGGALP